ncbi:carbohydrate ABC transporter permease [Ilumatobacter coccineus]|uniref:Sugar ABC transporter permease protein n=1 Tax=Ilumatobacter coccineus (strain NBRC 103263 / KCTC 29153 / YM16-304) TaxID=1313172 RepID=A0A6C7E7B1_ILUCY|nr:carbohydrate ABC transporter permease [Ilumatobacter coccineus]BAN03564.1 sugar ABC transporter permease protein [Ilumatobacter coccineus YM16-304]
MKQRFLSVRFLLTAVVALFWVFPFVLLVLNSFKTKSEIVGSPLSLPESFGTENFETAFDRMSFVSAVTNSLVITVGAGVLLVIFPAMFGYYLARFDYRSNRLLLALIIASMIIPFQALMIPFVSIYGQLELLNSRGYLILFYLGFGTSLSTFLYHGYIKSVPIAIEEAAIIDGATRFQVFWKVVFPMLKPITATVIVLNGLWIWNDYLLPSLVLQSGSRTLPLETVTFFGQFTTELGLAMAGVLLATLPILLFYLVMQRHIVSGISSGSVK